SCLLRGVAVGDPGGGRRADRRGAPPAASPRRLPRRPPPARGGELFAARCHCPRIQQLIGTKAHRATSRVGLDRDHFTATAGQIRNASREVILATPAREWRERFPGYPVLTACDPPKP